MQNQEADNNEEIKQSMSAKAAAAILSQTLRDVTERKVTIRHAMAVSRVAIALAKVIETADLNERVEFLEQVLKKKKQ